MVPTPAISGRSSAVTQPGPSSFTAGTALRARMPGGQAAGHRRGATGAVGEPERRLLADRGRPVDVDAVDVVAVARGPVRGRVEADPVHVLEADHHAAVVQTVDGEPDRSDIAGLDDALGGLAGSVGDPLLPGRGDLGQLDAGGVRDHRHRRTPRHDQQFRDLQQGGERRRAADAHLVLVVALVVGVVEQLRRAHRPDLAAQPHQGHREQVVGEPGVDAGGEARRAARSARCGDRVDPRGRRLRHRRPHPRRHRGGADVDAGAQERRHHPDVLVGVLRGRAVVDERVRPQCDQLVDRVGGAHAGRLGQAADVPSVATDLVGVGDADADQLERRVLHDLGDHQLPTTPVPQMTTRFFSNVIGRRPS